MRKNHYTKAVGELKVPERAIENALQAAATAQRNKEKAMKNNKWKWTGIAAAALAIVITAGSVIGANLMQRPNGNSFILKVGAAEISNGNTATVGADDDHTLVMAHNESGTVDYWLDLPLSCEGKNVKSVTYSVDKDAIAVICRKDNNPVVSGDVVSDKITSLYDVRYTAEDEEALHRAIEEKNDFELENPRALEIMKQYDKKTYSSVTLNADNQRPEGCVIGIIGSGDAALSPYVDNLLGAADDPQKLETQKELAQQLVGNTVHCTVTFTNGSTHTQDITIGATVSTFGKEHPEDFSALTPDEQKLKDYQGIFITFS